MTTRRPFRAGLGAAAAIVLWYLTLAPSTLGGPVTPVLTRGTSMHPTIATGDLVIAYRDRSLSPGEVAAFRTPAGSIVLHRIVTVDGDRVVTRGDHLGTDDPWDTRTGDVAGTARVHLRGVGARLRWLAQPVVLATLAAVAAVSLFLLARTPGAARPARRRGRRRAAATAALLALTVPVPGSLASLDVTADELASMEATAPFATYVDTPGGGPGGGGRGGGRP